MNHRWTKKNLGVDCTFFFSFTVLLLTWLDAKVGEVPLGVAAKDGLEVADKSVDIPLASRLLDDVFVIVVPQPTAQLLVVHLGLVLPQTPPTSNLPNSQIIMIY